MSLDDLQWIGDHYDFDEDGLVANKDNCPWIANADQRDADRDGYGDPCDPGDGILPSVSVVAPRPGQRFYTGTEVKLRADAADRDGRVVAVQFLANDEHLGESLERPYECMWIPLKPGRITLKAEATDDDNGTTISRPIVVTVIESR